MTTQAPNLARQKQRREVKFAVGAPKNELYDFCQLPKPQTSFARNSNVK
jgi:hypothetical protein